MATFCSLVSRSSSDTRVKASDYPKVVPLKADVSTSFVTRIHKPTAKSTDNRNMGNLIYRVRTVFEENLRVKLISF